MLKRLLLPIAPQAATGRILGATLVVLTAFFWFLATLGTAETRLIELTTLPSPFEVIPSVESLLKERGLFAAKVQPFPQKARQSLPQRGTR